MNGYKNNLYCMKSKLNHSITDNSSVLVLFLKALKVRTVLLESGNEFQSFGAIKLHDLRP